MPLNINELPIINQLSQAIKEMRDFLLDNPSDKERYKILYDKITKLTIKANTEGYYNYKHNNPYKTLSDFLKKNNIPKLVIKYYSIPPAWSRSLIKQSKLTKVIKGGKKLSEWLAGIYNKIKPF